MGLKVTLFCLIIASAIFSPPESFASDISEMTVVSSSDKFQLKKSGEKYLLDGKPIQLGALEDMLKVFTYAIEGPCEKMQRPDLTVTALVKGQSVKRSFFVEKRVVSDGKNCALVSGEGIYYLPLHRKWFQEYNDSIAIEDSLTVKDNQGKVLFSIIQKNGKWESRDQSQFLNWDFIRRFLQSIKSFPVNQHLHPAAAKGKPVLEVDFNRTTFKFYKVNSTLWALAKPKTNWLISSNAWTFWLDMDRFLWVDRFSDQFAKIMDANSPVEGRLHELRSLDGHWSPSIAHLLDHLLSFKAIPIEISLEAIRQLRQKPTNESMGTLIQALHNRSEPEVLSAISKALKVRNPKGPELKVDASPGQIEKARLEWKSWWKAVSHSKGQN